MTKSLSFRKLITLHSTRHVRIGDFQVEANSKRAAILVEYFFSTNIESLLCKKCGHKVVGTGTIVCMNLLKMQFSESEDKMYSDKFHLSKNNHIEM